MKYLILIHQNRNARADFASFPAEVQAAGLAAYQKLNADLVASGEYVSAEALDADSTATVIRGGQGSYVQTDGPFAETKEALGGYYVIEAADLDEAIAIAKQVPAPLGGVEVRPIHDLS